MIPQTDRPGGPAAARQPRCLGPRRGRTGSHPDGWLASRRLSREPSPRRALTAGTRSRRLRRAPCGRGIGRHNPARREPERSSSPGTAALVRTRRLSCRAAGRARAGRRGPRVPPAQPERGGGPNSGGAAGRPGGAGGGFIRTVEQAAWRRSNQSRRRVGRYFAAAAGVPESGLAGSPRPVILRQNELRMPRLGSFGCSPPGCAGVLAGADPGPDQATRPPGRRRGGRTGREGHLGVTRFRRGAAGRSCRQRCDGRVGQRQSDRHLPPAAGASELAGLAGRRWD